jgi:hypothetical protein
MKDQKEFLKKVSVMGDRLFIEIPKEIRKHYKKGDWVLVQPHYLRGR